ncbi:aminoglycoside phosphotransferase family protein [Paenibacillus barengoltzii]|uniref:aminoglycoside phosphotransferase family protein n=1 Tax=Paenibacillus barengoltzii TaxID=343517 RepID=UPI000FD872B2|nr:phosphotransferase family protein [Paenibacillus barengoltzii]
MFADIQGYETFKKIDPITKGWSSDQKYYIETVTNERWLLRIADISQYDHKKHEFEMMRRLAESGIPMSRPVDFGVCNNGQSVYSLSTWCDGEDAQAVLPKLTDTRQYHLGVTAGQILRQIHSIPAPVDQEPWESSFNRKVDRKIKQYHDCGVKMVGDEQIIAYIEANRHYLSERPQCFQHGDYHVGNMIISPEGELWIIDFNRWDYGDPWEEFNRIVWSAKVSPHFATGQIHGYFHGNPPDEFFTLLALYIGTNALSSIPWAIPFGEVEVAVMQQQARDVLTWFDGMRNPVPAWYLSDFKSSI